MGFTRWHLSATSPEFVYLAKTYILHHLVDLPNFNALPPSVIRFWKALEQANEIVQENQDKHTEKLPNKHVKKYKIEL